MKRIVYIVAWIALGLLLALIMHAGIEIVYIKYALANGLVLENHTAFGLGYCTLPTWLQALLFALGGVSGAAGGVYFWRILYIEKRHRKFTWFWRG